MSPCPPGPWYKWMAQNTLSPRCSLTHFFLQSHCVSNGGPLTNEKERGIICSQLPSVACTLYQKTYHILWGKGWFHSNVVIDRWSHHLLLICHGWCSFSSLCCRSVFVCLLSVVGCVTAPVELGVPLLIPEEVSDAFVGFPGTRSWILQLILDRATTSYGQVLLLLIIIIVKLIVICICILGGCTWELMLSGLIDVCAAIFVALG